MLNAFLVTNSYNLSAIEIILALVLPFILSFVIVAVYRRQNADDRINVAFIKSLFLFSCLSSVMTLIIGTNIARAFGLVGALSIIRFRTAIKSPIDTIYLFWALAVGMACGVGYYLAAFFIVVLCTTFLFILSKMKFEQPFFLNSVIKVSVGEDAGPEELAKLESTLSGRTKQMQKIDELFDSEKKKKTIVYKIKLDAKNDSKSIFEEIGGLKGVEKVHHLNTESSLFI